MGWEEEEEKKEWTDRTSWVVRYLLGDIGYATRIMNGRSTKVQTASKYQRHHPRAIGGRCTSKKATPFVPSLYLRHPRHISPTCRVHEHVLVLNSFMIPQEQPRVGCRIFGETQLQACAEPMLGSYEAFLWVVKQSPETRPRELFRTVPRKIGPVPSKVPALPSIVKQIPPPPPTSSRTRSSAAAFPSHLVGAG